MNWFTKLFALSPIKTEAALGAPVPILADKDNPFVNDDDLHDEDVRAQEC